MYQSKRRVVHTAVGSTNIVSPCTPMRQANSANYTMKMNDIVSRYQTGRPVDIIAIACSLTSFVLAKCFTGYMCLCARGGGCAHLYDFLSVRQASWCRSIQCQVGLYWSRPSLSSGIRADGGIRVSGFSNPKFGCPLRSFAFVECFHRATDVCGAQNVPTFRRRRVRYRVVSETGVRFGVSSTIREPTRPSSDRFPVHFVLLVAT